MSEKRFELAYEQGNWWAVRDGDITLWKEEVVDKMNEQQDKISELEEELEKSSVFIIEQRKENKTLKEGNEQLKKAEKINMEYAEQIVEENQKLRIAKNDLRIENEQLRKIINEVIELLVEEVDLFSDKATEHDIIAYKEMNEFDNKDAYYICTATKKAIQMLKGRDSDE